MKLDYDCIRHILITIEEINASSIYLNNLANEAYDLHTISYHVRLLLDVGYVHARPYFGSANYEEFIIMRMTMQGHEYLNSIRNDNIWTETKNKIQKLAGTASLDIIKAVATKISLNLLGL